MSIALYLEQRIDALEVPGSLQAICQIAFVGKEVQGAGLGLLESNN